MSGIACIVHFDGAPVPADHIGRMTQRMQRRGPDGIQHWQQGPVALGHCMLHTTPESLEELQPLANEDASLVLVLDGRVDNWLELRAELLQRGAVLRTRADAELVLRAFEIWGEPCVEHIDGDFAFVIWNRREQRVFAARDRTGARSLFYWQDAQRLLLATDQAALLDVPGIPRVLNETLLQQVLGFCIEDAGQTLWQGVSCLPPATALSMGAGHRRQYRYWQPDPDLALPCRSDADHVVYYRELLEDNVRRQSRSHAPLAFEVSGGQDSSGVFALALQLQRDGRLLAPGIKAWTLGGLSGEAAIELPQVHALAEFWKQPIHEVAACFPGRDWYAARAQELQDFPGYPNSAMMGSLLEAAAGKGSRVMFNGVGGDVWLWGSREYYAEELAALRWGTLWRCLQRDAKEEGWRSALFWLLRYGFFGLLPRAVQRHLILGSRALRGHPSEGQERYWLAADLRKTLAPALARLRQASLWAEGKQYRKTGLQDDQALWAQQTYDRDYATFGLEARSPLNTAALIQFSVVVPERLLRRGSSQKWVHVEALRNLLPEAITNREDRADFSAAFCRPLDGIDAYFRDELPSARPDWVDRAGLQRLYAEYGSKRGGWPPWHLWVLTACDAFVTNAITSPQQR